MERPSSGILGADTRRPRVWRRSCVVSSSPENHAGQVPRVLLGPTNTGKTTYALTRLTAYRTGVLAVPLRLLARENYERLVQAHGSQHVALLTGEERVGSQQARWVVATIEAMPRHRVDFLAIDEIQLATDPQRGHVFTDRLLYWRGWEETLWLGSDSMEEVVRRLVPRATIEHRPRLSRLSWVAAHPLEQTPPDSAVVVFSTRDVARYADRLRASGRSSAVVAGFMPPSTRSAQVASFHEGEVDTLVATDAIGMGLNLTINRVSFAAVHKFDGERVRPLHSAELGQIAGRAGRGNQDGLFGCVDEVVLDRGVIHDIERQRFGSVRWIRYRYPNPDTQSLASLWESLQTPAPEDLKDVLNQHVHANDERALTVLSGLQDAAHLSSEDVRDLWSLCCVPNYFGLDRSRFIEHLSWVWRARLDGRLDQMGPTIQRVLDRFLRVNPDRHDVDPLPWIARSLERLRWFGAVNRLGWVTLSRQEDLAEQIVLVEQVLSDRLHGVLRKRFGGMGRRAVAGQLARKNRAVMTEDDRIHVDDRVFAHREGWRVLLQRPETIASPQTSIDSLATPSARLRLAEEVVRDQFPALLRQMRQDFAVAHLTDETHTTGIDDQADIRWRGASIACLVPQKGGMPKVSLWRHVLTSRQALELQAVIEDWCDKRLRLVFNPLWACLKTLQAVGATSLRESLAQGYGVMSLPTHPRAEVLAILRQHGFRVSVRRPVALLSGGGVRIYHSRLMGPLQQRWRWLLRDRESPHASITDAADDGSGVHWGDQLWSLSLPALRLEPLTPTVWVRLDVADRLMRHWLKERANRVKAEKKAKVEKVDKAEKEQNIETTEKVEKKEGAMRLDVSSEGQKETQSQEAAWRWTPPMWLSEKERSCLILALQRRDRRVRTQRDHDQEEVRTKNDRGVQKHRPIPHQKIPEGESGRRGRGVRAQRPDRRRPDKPRSRDTRKSVEGLSKPGSSGWTTLADVLDQSQRQWFERHGRKGQKTTRKRSAKRDSTMAVQPSNRNRNQRGGRNGKQEIDNPKSSEGLHG